MEKLIRIINNQKIKGNLKEPTLSTWINRKKQTCPSPSEVIFCFLTN